MFYDFVYLAKGVPNETEGTINLKQGNSRAVITLLCSFNSVHSRTVTKRDVTVSSVHGSQRKI